MKVTNDRPVTGPQRKGASRAPDGGDAGRFSDMIGRTGAAEGSQGTAAVGPTQAADSLLALQEVPDAVAGRRRAVKRGGSLLDHLDAIRVGLLTGTLSRDRLIALARQLREPRDQALDPAAAELLAEIELRAEVELAKLSRSS